MIIDALNAFPYNKHKKEEIVYDATENLLKQFKKSSNGYIEAVKPGLKMLVPKVTNHVCKEFIEVLCHEICKDKNNDLYKEIEIIRNIHERKYYHNEFRKSNQNDEKILGDLKIIKGSINGQDSYKPGHSIIPIKNRAQDYADKWNENVFLNNFDAEDENAGTNIKLKEIYKEVCLPHYIWKENIHPSQNTIDDLLNKYIVDSKKMLLILGQPGIGKSTLITWIVVNFRQKRNDILVYQFASDLKKVNWESDNLLDEIQKAIELDYSQLKSKILILDGFDEIHISVDRERILNKLGQELEKLDDSYTFSLIITCRENYVNRSNLWKLDYITLQPWSEEQIRSFCAVYEKVCAKENTESKIN